MAYVMTMKAIALATESLFYCVNVYDRNYRRMMPIPAYWSMYVSVCFIFSCPFNASNDF